MYINEILDVVGAAIGLLFILVHIKASRSLMGSFFKRYYKWMIFGACLMFLSFSVDSFGGWFGLMDDTADFIHHLLIIAFSGVFVIAARILPKEAAERIKI